MYGLEKSEMKLFLLCAFLVLLISPQSIFAQSTSSPQDIRNVIHPIQQEVLTSGTDYEIEWVMTKPYPVAYMVVYTQKGNFTIGPADSGATKYLWHIPDTLKCLCSMIIKDGANNNNIGWVDSFIVAPSSSVANETSKYKIFSRQILAMSPPISVSMDNMPDSYILYS